MEYPVRIIVVDDEEIERDNISRVLKREGWDHDTFSDPIEALEHIKEEDYDIALLDFRMPKMDGIELMREIRALQKDIDVIFMTAQATVESASEAVRLGAFDYILRRFPMPHLVSVIKRALSVRQFRQQLDHICEVVTQFGGNEKGMEKLMEELAERIASALKPNMIYAVAGYESKEWQLLACRGLDESRRAQAEANILNGLEAKVQASMHPVIVSDTSKLVPRFRGVGSAMVVPMVHNGEFLGVVYIGSQEKENFTESPKHENFPRTQEDLRFVTIMAGLGATAIQQTREAMKLIEASQKKAEAETKRAKAEAKRAKAEAKRARAEAERDKARAEAEQVKTLSLWTGHAVKNRNWVISGRAKLLRESAETDKERNDLDVILRKAHEIDRILEKFRYVSMKSEAAIHPRPTNLHHLITSTLEEVMKRSPDQTVKLKKDFDDALGEVRIDPVEMKEVLTNLVTNALRAMPDGGTLTLKTKRDNRWLRISISDTGRGISAENQKHLFKPFFSTTSGGLGLGLWLSRQIVENHRGKLDLKNRDEEKGAEALIKLPLEGGEPSGEVENSDS